MQVYTDLSETFTKFAGVAIHDIEKLNEFCENGICRGYSFKGRMLGHIVQGITLVNDLLNSVSKEEKTGTARTHDTLSSLRTRVWKALRSHCSQKAEMLHYLDIVDARMFDMEEGGSREFQTVSSVTVCGHSIIEGCISARFRQW